MLELYDLVAEGTELTVIPPVEKKGKLIFFDCDCTLASIEGIDELARHSGDAVFEKVSSLTHAAMNGEVALDQVFAIRMDIIRPDQSICDAVSQQYLNNVTPGAKQLIALLKANGWTPVILSGGFAPLIRPLAKELGIDHIEAVPLFLNEDGSYAGYGEDYPTTRNLGKNQVIREWKEAMLPGKVVMVGDGISDLETTPDVDLFIGYGGAVARPRVHQAADHWITNMTDYENIFSVLDTIE
ncbi:HAD-IB family phosphatase [Luteolibacter pohnpeiensis]|uniref:phosphoserine phosphatase n=2 Tax=Luteolibacter pohnpeiensis TaxID=454153 RepID=A0A934S282_9BACT|nr:HAD-IB family phosphatase [Luteolibacter pohnpeiensis]